MVDENEEGLSALEQQVMAIFHEAKAPLTADDVRAVISLRRDIAINQSVVAAILAGTVRATCSKPEDEDAVPEDFTFAHKLPQLVLER